ncbi:DUF998 domain-containing protein [Pleurocapsa sp. PCC 7319]|uniref:DUF998 domain-containing protein n=1 Tax=Pleurocapsa sp. PCC 7319 TaxID=118161 RepID=UPI00034B6CBD|nr:DUF998 domain-containing protein [Pleurocapsa sp. PCC 7319]
MNEKTELSGSPLLKICGVIGIIGCIAAIATDIIGIIVVKDHNPISETISSLAIEKSAWIQDMGLDFYAAGMIACGIGLYVLNLNGLRWKIGSVLLGLLGIDVILIAEHNQYAGREGVGASIHIQCVYALAVLFAAITLLLSFGLRRIGRNWYRYSLGTAIVWTVLAPIFFFVPTNIDGAYERFISLITISWVAAMSWLLIKRGQGKLSFTS